jgi:hypothetical protein
MSLSTQVLSTGASIAAAILALVSAVYAVRLTTRTSKEVEVLKVSLARESAIDEARRNYEYDARKRVYVECEPLVLRLAESSEPFRVTDCHGV